MGVFHVFKLYEWYQIAQRTTFVLHNKDIQIKLLSFFSFFINNNVFTINLKSEMLMLLNK